MKKLLFGFWVLLSIYTATAVASDSVMHISDENTFYNPAPHMSFLIDLNNQLKISDILQPEYQQKFTPLNGDMTNFGMITSGIWLRFKVQNQLDDSPYLEMSNPGLDTIEYFLFNKAGQLVHHQLTGNFKKIKDRTVQSWLIMEDMNLAAKEPYTCYLKINTETSTTVAAVRIAHLKKFYAAKHSNAIWQGLYFGLVIFMFIYNLFLFFSLKDNSYLFFGMFIASVGVLFALIKGFGFQYIWAELPQINKLMPFVGSLTGISIILFTSSFLNAKERTPKLRLWLLALSAFYLIIIALNLVGINVISSQLLIYNTIIVIFFILFVAVKSWSEGYLPSKFFLLAWSFFVVGFIIFLMRENGIIGVNVFVANILQITSVITVLFLSFALSKKINIYIDNRNEARELALAAAVENERLVSNQNMLLEAKVHQRTIDLEQSITTLSKQSKDLHEANRFKDKVFSIISHDLKSPIASLAGMLKLMKIKSLDELERTKIVESLEVALKGTKILLDNILAWANKQDKKAIEKDEVELFSATEDVTELFRYQADIKRIAINNFIEKDFHIYTNKNMLQLVLRNLVSNAIKFTPKNGKVEIFMEQNFLDLSIIVQDSGVGMSRETLDNLFKTNRHNSTPGTENEKGTGLGLMLCKEFVDKYNGKLTVKSELGKGSTFIITLRQAIPVLETVLS